MYGLSNTDLYHLARLRIDERIEDTKSRRLSRAVRAVRADDTGRLRRPRGR